MGQMQVSDSAMETNSTGLLANIRQQTWYQKLSAIPVKVLAPFISEKKAKQLVKYGMVGVSGTIIELGLLNFFIFILGWDSDFQKVMANVIALSVAIVNSFTWNRLWTFPESRDGEASKQFVKFVVVSIVGLTINSIIFFLADKYIFSPWLPVFVAVQLAKFTAIGITLMWNFTINRFWTFKSDTA